MIIWSHVIINTDCCFCKRFHRCICRTTAGVKGSVLEVFGTFRCHSSVTDFLLDDLPPLTCSHVHLSGVSAVCDHMLWSCRWLCDLHTPAALALMRRWLISILSRSTWTRPNIQQPVWPPAVGDFSDFTPTSSFFFLSARFISQPLTAVKSLLYWKLMMVMMFDSDQSSLENPTVLHCSLCHFLPLCRSTAAVMALTHLCVRVCVCV